MDGDVYFMYVLKIGFQYKKIVINCLCEFSVRFYWYFITLLVIQIIFYCKNNWVYKWLIIVPWKEHFDVLISKYCKS
jgi:hypothetical protein